MRKAENAVEVSRSGSPGKVWLSPKLLCYGVALLMLGFTSSMSAQNKTSVYAVRFENNGEATSGINFYCVATYSIDKCKQHVVVLRNVLKHLHMQAIAPWSFILVPAGEWNELLGQASGPAGSPAFTALHSRDTFLSQSLFAPTMLQQAEQMQLFGLRGEDLLNFSVAHEFAHAACRDLNEVKANAYATQSLHAASAERRAMPACRDMR